MPGFGFISTFTTMTVMDTPVQNQYHTINTTYPITCFIPITDFIVKNGSICYKIPIFFWVATRMS